jgi:hypothetical protein
MEDEDTYQGFGDLSPEEFEDLYTDGLGNCFSDADPGL